MATLHLDLLECLHPDDPMGADEIRVSIYCDGSLAGYEPELRMHEGDRAELATPDGYPFTDIAQILLEESDPFRIEQLGSVSIGHILPEGPQTAYLPSELVGEHATCYRLTYHVDSDEDDASRRRNRIELLSLYCNDAQGSHDTVRLFVNDDLLWGPANMWSRQGVDLGEDLSADFRTSATVRLEDSRGEPWRSEFTVRYGSEDYLINTPLTYRFHVDRGITGDATYTVTYRLRRLPAH